MESGNWGSQRSVRELMYFWLASVKTKTSKLGFDRFPALVRCTSIPLELG